MTAKHRASPTSYRAFSHSRGHEPSSELDPNIHRDGSIAAVRRRFGERRLMALQRRLESRKASRLCPVVQTSTYGESVIDLNAEIAHRPLDLISQQSCTARRFGSCQTAMYRPASLVTTGPRLVVDMAEVTRCSSARIPMIPTQLETCREGRRVPSDA